MSKEEQGVFDADIERLEALAMKEPNNGSNIVGLGAVLLAAVLHGLQEQQREQRKTAQDDD